ncbi:MAG: DUF507 family protein [Nitrospira sp.]|nr:MAG: hypothetical protein CCU27_12245 [Nitrospira sp. UW-LDO-02]HAN47753.1 DUF507 domain-containing protein [Nitrospira sp.]HAN91742.1 DUF507 domain-containing protein [Nitrospira sp.]
MFVIEKRRVASLRTGVQFVISDDKASHLAHLALGALKKSPHCRFTEDDGKVLREIKRVVAAELLLEAEIDKKVRTKLASYSRQIVEGSPEWDVMYRKTAEEEQKKRAKP